MRHVADAAAALVDLKTIVGLGPDAPLTLRDDLDQQLRKDGADAGAVAGTPDRIVERPDVREAEARIRVAAARIRQLRGEARVDVTAYGGYMQMDTGFPQRGFNDAGTLEQVRGLFHYAEFGGMVIVPLFNRNQGAIAAAEGEKRAAERTREARELSARGELASARAREIELRKGLELYVRARDLARKNVEVVRESYQLGRNTLFDVFAEQRRLLEIETEYAEALARVFAAHTDVLRATGEKP